LVAEAEDHLKVVLELYAPVLPVAAVAVEPLTGHPTMPVGQARQDKVTLEETPVAEPSPLAVVEEHQPREVMGPLIKVATVVTELHPPLLALASLAQAAGVADCSAQQQAPEVRVVAVQDRIATPLLQQEPPIRAVEEEAAVGLLHPVPAAVTAVPA
jgi:hypothetical protein